eukprot:Rmarinus@m.27279
MKVILVRHGERIDDVSESWSLSAERPFDPPLTTNGIKQADLTAKRLADAGVTHVFSSPFLRCVQTALPIARAIGQSIRLEDGFSEWVKPSYFPLGLPDRSCLTVPVRLESNLGSRSNRDLSAAGIEPSLIDWTQHSHTAFPPAWESPTCMASRVEKALAGVLQNLGSRDVAVVVTHGYGIQMAVESLMPDLFVIDTPYCCISTFRAQFQPGAEEEEGDNVAYDGVNHVPDPVSPRPAEGCKMNPAEMQVPLSPLPGVGTTAECEGEVGDAVVATVGAGGDSSEMSVLRSRSGSGSLGNRSEGECTPEAEKKEGTSSERSGGILPREWKSGIHAGNLSHRDAVCRSKNQCRFLAELGGV